MEKKELIEEIPLLPMDATITKAVSLFQELRNETTIGSAIAIVDDKNKFFGLLRPHDIIGKGIKGSAPVKTYAAKNIPVIHENDDVINDPEEIADLMRQADIRHIPILDRFDRVIGAIRDRKLLEILILNNDTYDQISVRNALSSSTIITLLPTDSIGTAIAEMRKSNFSQIPVFESSINEIIGIVETREVLKSHLSTKTTKGDVVGDREKDWYLLPISDIMSEAFFINGDDSIKKAATLMIENNIHSLIVEDRENYGIVTARDLIRFHILQQEVPGFNVIVTQAPDEDIKDHAIRKSLSIMNTFRNYLGNNCTIRIRFKRNMAQSKGGQFSTTAMIRLTSEKGHIYTTESTDFGAEKSVNAALDNLARIISEDKDKLISRYKRRSLRRSDE